MITTHAQGGRRAQSIGDAFEKHLTAAHIAYAGVGIAQVWKVPVATAPVTHRLWKSIETACKRAGIHSFGQLRRVTSKAKDRELAPFDYMGVVGRGRDDDGPMHASGRMIAMEAKADLGTNGKPKTSLAISDKGSGIALHQLDALCEVHAAGGIACVVWYSGPSENPRRIVFGGDVLTRAREERLDGGRKSIPATLGQPYHKAMVGTRVVEHWLPAAVMKWLEDRA